MSKRQSGQASAGAQKRPKKKSSFRDDFLVASDSDEEDVAAGTSGGKKRGAAQRNGASGQRGDSDSARVNAEEVGDEAEDPYAEETPDERRLRMARSYLSQLEAQMGTEDGNSDADEDEDGDADSAESSSGGERSSDKLNRRLQQDALLSEGRLKRLVAHTYADAPELGASSVSILGRTNTSVTSVAMTGDASSAFAGCKDGSIVRWDIATGQKTFTMKGVPTNRNARQNPSRSGSAAPLSAAAASSSSSASASASASASSALKSSRLVAAPSFASFLNKNAERAPGHIGAVHAVAVSEDGRLLASGGVDKVVRIWDARTNTQVRALVGHRDMISALCFRASGGFSAGMGSVGGGGGGHTLYSGSHDRTVKIWDCDQLGYIETLFGHQSPVTALDALRHERALSAGGVDRSVRLWKIPEESQLLYQNAPDSLSIDCARMLNEELYISGSQSGTLSMWLNTKKKAIAELPRAHDGSWITSVACLPYTDVFASGASDGHLRIWQAVTPAAGTGPSAASSARASLRSLGTVPIPGFVNSLAFARSGQFLLAGVGQEHRCGRWQRIPEARNGVHLVRLPHA